MATRELKVNIVGDSKDLERALGKASKSSHSLGSSFVSLAKYAALAGVALGAVAAVGIKKSIDAASDLEEQINKTNVVFAGSEKQVIEWSRGLEKSFGLSSRAALEAAGTYGNMLVPMGFARKEASKMSETMVELAGDMASFNNASPEDTLKAIQSGLAGQARPLRQYGVFLSAARTEQEALTETGKKSAKQLTEQEKATARYNLILKDTKDTQGDFARSAGDSMANQMRILKAQFEDAAAAIGTALLPAVIRLMQLLGQVVPVIADFAIKLSDAVAPSVIAAVQSLEPLFQNLKQSVLDLVNAARQLVPTLRTIGSTTVSIGMSQLGQSAIVSTAAMVGFHAIAVKVIARLVAMRAAVAGAGLASLATPLGAATAAVGALTAAFILSRGASDVLGDSITRQRDALKSLLDVADASVASEDRLRDAKLGLQQATLSVSAAIKRRNEIEAEGKKGTDEYKQATLNVQQAYAGRIRAEHELKDAQSDNTKATADQGAAIRHLKTDSEDLRARMATLTDALGGFGKEMLKKQQVTAYANEMDRSAKKADALAEKIGDSNPKLATAARNFADNARAAADYARQTGKIPASLEKAVSGAGAAGQRVGASFGQGIYQGIGSYISSITEQAAAAVRAAEAGARSAAKAKSPSLLFEAVGGDLMKGMAQGVTKHQKEVADAAAKAVQAAHDAVVNAKGVFASAFEELSSAALAAFDKLSDDFQTRTEKKIARQDAAREKAARQRALAEANTALAAAQGLTAQAGEDPAEFAKRQSDALTAAMEQRNEALFAIQRAKDEQTAAQERKAYEDSRERQRVAFEKQLGNLETQLENGRISVAKFRQKLLALFEKYDIPFRKAGQLLGAALSAGLHDSFSDAAAAAADLIQAIAKELKKKAFVVTVNVDTDHPAHRQHGGPVRQGSPYIVGEAGPELFIPSRSGTIVPSLAGVSGAGMAEVHTHVYLDSTQIAEVIRREYLRFEKRNGRAAV